MKINLLRKKNICHTSHTKNICHIYHKKNIVHIKNICNIDSKILFNHINRKKWIKNLA